MLVLPTLAAAASAITAIVEIVGGLVALLIGRRAPWLWFTLAIYALAGKFAAVVLYREVDLVRNAAMLTASAVATILAYVLDRRFHRPVVAVGGFFAGGLIFVQALGPLLNRAPEWLVLSMLVAAGVASAWWTRREPARAQVVLSTLVGAGFVSNYLVDALNVDEAARFQVYALLAVAGVLFQVGLARRSRGRGRGGPAALPLSLMLLIILLGGCLPSTPGAEPRYLYNPRNRAEPPSRPTLALANNDRILVFAPHPDDEVLAAGGLIQQAIARNLPVRVVFLTNGDNNEFAYLFFRKAFTLDPRSAVQAGITRGFEAMRAGRQLGLSVGDEAFLGYPDFGTLEIWLSRWRGREPFRSMFTQRNSVPYWFAVRPDAPYVGELVLGDIERQITDFGPTKIFVSHPADLNPDHEALYLFLRVALFEQPLPVQPKVYAFMTHYGRWPQPRGLLMNAPQEPPARFDEVNRWVSLPLAPPEVQVKLNALQWHQTQYEASRAFLQSYIRSTEIFDRLDDIPVPADGSSIAISAGGSALVDVEVGSGRDGDVETRRVRRDGDSLVFSFERPGKGPGVLRVQSFLMGYRHDRAFSDMPKFELNMTGPDYRLTERRSAVDQPLQVNSTPTLTEVRMRLALLGDPEYLFFAGHTRPELVRLDSMPWVVLKLEGE